MENYAKVLCDAVKAYCYPAVTYDFKLGKENNHCEPDTTHQVKSHRQCMREVEENIRSQLLSKNPEEVKNGLSNVLYWGYASQRKEGDGPCDGYIPMTGRQKDRIPKFCRHVNENKRKLDRFSHLARNSRGYDLTLSDIKDIEMAEFKTGMAFISKIRMFLDPNNYPVLDREISKLADVENSPIQDLKIHPTYIPIHKPDPKKRDNHQIYEEWAKWCRNIAKQVNSYPYSPLKDLRAVDVERAIYKLSQSNKQEAWKLLQGPKPEN